MEIIRCILLEETDDNFIPKIEYLFLKTKKR